MPEEGGQQRHPPVDVLAGVKPVEQRAHGQGMAEIVRAGSGASAAAVQADLADQLRERPVEFLARHPPTARADEERRRCGLGETSVAQPRIVAQRADRAGVQRHLALLLLLARADVHHAVAKIDVLAVERERLPGAHPGDRQQPDQRLMTRGAQRRAESPGGRDQRRDLVLGVDVWRDPRAMAGQQVLGGDLAGGVDRREVAREPAHDRQPLTPAVRVRVAPATAPTSSASSVVIRSAPARSRNSTNPSSSRPSCGISNPSRRRTRR